MPKIREYGVPNLEFSNTPVSPSTDLRNAGLVARAKQGFGETLQQTGDLIYKRQEQEQVSDLNAKSAQLEAEATVEIDEATRDETIDTKKVMESLDDRLNKLGEGISTGGARSVYERNSARLREAMLRRAARGEATVKGNRAYANMDGEINSRSSSLFTDPRDFDYQANALFTSIEDEVASGTLKPGDAKRLRAEAGQKLSMGAVQGWARLDPSAAEKELYSGKYDSFLDGVQKKEMQTYINAQKSAKLTEIDRLEAADRRAKRLAAEAWDEKNLSKMMTGEIPAEEILHSPGTAAQRAARLRAARQNALNGGGGISNPALIAKLQDQILAEPGSPDKIEDVSQLYAMVGNGLTLKDVEALNREIQKTPEGEALRGAKKALVDQAKQQILIKDYLSGRGYLPQTYQNLQKFNQWRALQEKEAAQNKIPISSLYDPNSNNYLGKPERLRPFMLSMGAGGSIMNAQAAEAASKQPFVPATKPDPIMDEKKPRPGESIDAWEKRTGQ